MLIMAQWIKCLSSRHLTNGALPVSPDDRKNIRCIRATVSPLLAYVFRLHDVGNWQTCRLIITVATISLVRCSVETGCARRGAHSCLERYVVQLSPC